MLGGSPPGSPPCYAAFPSFRGTGALEKEMQPGQQDPSSPPEELRSGDVTGPAHQKVWEPTFFYKNEQEVHYYADCEIRVQEALDSYGAVVWPASLALCRYLDVNRETLDLRDRAVLELGAGTGLVSIVASLLGAWVTATDLPELLGNLRSNLSRNTRGRCRYTPQAAALSWGRDLERTFPLEVYRYDYVLAADVVYHHDFLAELLATMRHFCRPGSTLIWANKVRFSSDRAFAEDMGRAFDLKLLEDSGGVEIYSATAKGSREGSKSQETEETEVALQDVPGRREGHPEGADRRDGDAEGDTDNNRSTGGRGVTGGEKKERNDPESRAQPTAGRSEPNTHLEARPSKVCHIPGKEIHFFMGHRITIDESLDSYGAVIWPAAVALYEFLESPDGQERVNLQDRTVLEIGAGTGLLSVVVTLLGAKLTATDLPEILGNLSFNLNRNTRTSRRHRPQVRELSWGQRLEETFPRELYRYDYVLAADVVYHHDFLHELLLTMHHFCQPGTTLIWANKTRYRSDLVFLRNFQEAFHSTLLAELDQVRIYSATYRREKLGLSKNGREWKVDDKEAEV